MLVPLLLLVVQPKLSAPKIYQPKVGSPERKALMDALRKVTRPSLRQSVVFRVDWIRSNGDAAFFEGLTVRPDGKPIDYLKTNYTARVRDRLFDDGVYALWRKRKGKWIVDEWGIGDTEAPWYGMWKTKRVPRGLFPSGGRE